MNDDIYVEKASISGDGFQLDDSYTLLGEVESVVPRTEQPTENFQTNIAGASAIDAPAMLPDCTIDQRSALSLFIRYRAKATPPCYAAYIPVEIR